MFAQAVVFFVGYRDYRAVLVAVGEAESAGFCRLKDAGLNVADKRPIPLRRAGAAVVVKEEDEFAVGPAIREKSGRAFVEVVFDLLHRQIKGGDRLERSRRGIAAQQPRAGRPAGIGGFQEQAIAAFILKHRRVDYVAGGVPVKRFRVGKAFKIARCYVIYRLVAPAVVRVRRREVHHVSAAGKPVYIRRPDAAEALRRDFDKGLLREIYKVGGRPF